MAFLKGLFFVIFPIKNKFYVLPFTTFIAYYKIPKPWQKKNLPQKIQSRKKLC